MLTRPQDLVGRRKFEHLANRVALAVAAEEGEDLAKVEEHVLVHGREVARLARVRVARVEEDDLRARVRLDERLEVRGRGERERDVVVAEAGMELHGLPALARGAHRGMHDVVVERLVREAQRAPRGVDEDQRHHRALEHADLLGRGRDVEPGAVARDRLEADDLGVRPVPRERVGELLLERLQ